LFVVTERDVKPVSPPFVHTPSPDSKLKLWVSGVFTAVAVIVAVGEAVTVPVFVTVAVGSAGAALLVHEAVDIITLATTKTLKTANRIFFMLFSPYYFLFVAKICPVAPAPLNPSLQYPRKSPHIPDGIVF
jgi:hypothetical protein